VGIDREDSLRRNRDRNRRNVGALAALTRATAATLLLGALPSCGAVMHSFGDHVIFAEGHGWHTVPAKAGLGLLGNVTAVVLFPMAMIGMLTSHSVVVAYFDISTDAALAGGVLLGTPFWLVGLPFESNEDDQSATNDTKR
jgi:hypothetical protein